MLISRYRRTIALIDHDSTQRRTQHRLLIAMGVAVGLLSIVVALLEVLLDFDAVTLARRSTPAPGIEIRIRQNDVISKSESSQELEEIAVAEITRAPEFVPAAVLADPQPVIRPATDWRKIITESVAETATANARLETSRSAMWRQTRSSMFQPVNERVVKEQDPIIADFKFKPEIHVAGLGLTIGSCFIGVPLAGVPVEERTVAITVFVCAKG